MYPLSFSPGNSLINTGVGGGSNPAAPYNPYLNPSFESVNDVRRFMRQAGWGERPGEAQVIFDSGIKAGDLFEAQMGAPFDYMMYSHPLGNGPGDNNSRPHLFASWVEFMTSVDGKPEQFTNNNARYYPAYIRGNPLRSRLVDAMTKVWCLGFVQTTEFGSALQVRQYNAFVEMLGSGTIRDVIDWLTYDPGMGRFLDNGDNAGFKGGLPIEPNQNWFRELVQLFTIGMKQQTLFGQDILDGNGLPVPTYTYNDVFNGARMMSGLQVSQFLLEMNPGSSAGRQEANIPYLGVSRPAYGGTPPAGNRRDPALGTVHGDICRTLDVLCNLDQTFVYLAIHFISELTNENPSPDYVRYVVAALQNDGNNRRGVLRAMFRAILTHPEARGTGKPAGYGRAKDFFLGVANLWRAAQQEPLFTNIRTKGTIENGDPIITAITDSMTPLTQYAPVAADQKSRFVIDYPTGTVGANDGISASATLASVDSATQVTMSVPATKTATNFAFRISRSPRFELLRLLRNTSGWDGGASNNSILALQEPGMVPSVFSHYPFDYKVGGQFARAAAIWDSSTLLAWFKATMGGCLGHVATVGGLNLYQAGVWQLTAMTAGAPTNTQLIDRAVEYLLIDRTLPADARTELINCLDTLVSTQAATYGAPDDATKLKRRAATALCLVANMPEYMEQM